MFGEPESAQFQLRFHLFLARGLPASDKTGLSDPYLIVRLCGKKLQSKKRLATTNPQWYESYAMVVDDVPMPLSLAPYIQVSQQLMNFMWDTWQTELR